MSESFEAKLIAASSKEVFKKAKQILKNGELLCCHESAPGLLRAVCRDAEGFVSRAELRGFPHGPFSGSCTCASSFAGFCPHAMAAALYHAQYTVKFKETEPAADMPAQYAGLQFSGLPQLLTEMMSPPVAQVRMEAESEFPHVPSKWERVPLRVTLVNARREYSGNLNNLKQLHFDKNLAAALQLSNFSLQDRQIIRFLAINAQQDSARLSLDAEQCAEFFHCLVGFDRFTRLGEKIVVHPAPAQPVIFVEKLQSGYLLKSAVMVNDSALPLDNVKVITGRAGCWVGMLGEYWWIPARSDVAWLRNFLRTTVQPCDAKAAKILLNPETALPVKVLPGNGIRVRPRKFKTLYDGVLSPDGALELEVQFDYGGRLCPADQSRLGAVSGGSFWRRNNKGEFDVIQELVHFGFETVNPPPGKRIGTKFLLRDREAVGMFVDELIPRWLREKRTCLISSRLAALCGDFGRLRIRTELVGKSDASFDLAVSLSAGGVPVRWRDLADAARRNEFFMSAGADLFVKIPNPLRLLAATSDAVAEPLPPLSSHPDADVFRIPAPAAFSWAETAASIPGAVPLEFLRMKVDMDDLREAMKSPSDPVNHALFSGALRPYQQAGVYWMRNMGSRGFNLILSDEMGLGKTIQTLALLSADPHANLPALIVCPTSLTENWLREAAKFVPKLKTLVIRGAERSVLWEKAMSQDICIVSYAILKRDLAYLEQPKFKYLVLDEAQHIKNPHSMNAQSCKAVFSEHRLVLTGTPLENSAEDLWSIFDFLHPGLFGTLTNFRAKYLELARNADLAQELAGRIAPLILRRKKCDVSQDLPPKTEQLLSCTMDNGQAALYAKFAAEAEARCRDLRNGVRSVSNMDVLTSLLRLRQICCDPAMLPDDLLRNSLNGLKPPSSAKMELLQEVLMESLDSGHKVLVFSQFTSLLKLVRNWLDLENVPYEYLDGSTRNRMERVDSFNQSEDIRVFLLSLKAGGLGLNLTSADTVILYDPWWNPAAEMQAEDRTHRIGQTRSVNCIKLVVKDSIEEKVLELQARKKALFGSLIEKPGSAMNNLTLEDFEFLLKP